MLAFIFGLLFRVAFVFGFGGARSAIRNATMQKPLHRSSQFRDSIVVSISACHADDPGSIPGRGVLFVFACVETNWDTRRATKSNTTPRGFEPLRAEPIGFLVQLLNHSDTVSRLLVEVATPIIFGGLRNRA